MYRIAVLSATKFEMPSCLMGKNSNRWQKEDCTYIDIFTSGIGQKKARAKTREICMKQKPDLLIFLGFCGGISTVHVGKILIATSVHYNNCAITINNSLFNKMDYSNALIITGKLETFDQPVTSMSMISDHDIMGVDMESFAVADESQKHNIPILIVKVITDILPDKKPRFFPQLKVLSQIFFNCWFRKVRNNLNKFTSKFLNQYLSTYSDS